METAHRDLTPIQIRRRELLAEVGKIIQWLDGVCFKYLSDVTLEEHRFITDIRSYLGLDESDPPAVFQNRITLEDLQRLREIRKKILRTKRSFTACLRKVGKFERKKDS